MFRLVVGGVSSGKSRYAENCALRFSNVVYVATATIVDDDAFKLKIIQHQKRRPAQWQNLCCPIHLTRALETHAHHYVLIDCISMWLFNLLEAKLDVLSHIKKLQNALQEHTGLVTIVSNEIGLGGIGGLQNVRDFQMHLGALNQTLAQAASSVHYVVAGIAMKIK